MIPYNLIYYTHNVSVDDKPYNQADVYAMSYDKLSAYSVFFCNTNQRPINNYIATMYYVPADSTYIYVSKAVDMDNEDKDGNTDYSRVILALRAYHQKCIGSYGNHTAALWQPYIVGMRADYSIHHLNRLGSLDFTI